MPGRRRDADQGRPGAGRIAVGAPADLVAVRTDTVRTAGSDPAQIVLVAGASDVSDVVAGGDLVVRDGVHRAGDVARMLAEAIEEIWAAAERDPTHDDTREGDA